MVNLAAVDLAENGAPRQVHALFSMHTPVAPSPPMHEAVLALGCCLVCYRRLGKVILQ
jgi:hypothetical protein